MKIVYRQYLALVILLIGSFSVTWATPPTFYHYVQQSRSRIITASSVRVRSEPDVSGKELGKLAVGTVVAELERSGDKSEVGNLSDYWYRIKFEGKEGWVFGGFTLEYQAAQRDQIYHNLMEQRLKTKTNFNDQIDLLKFVDRAIKETQAKDALAEWQLYRLLAIKKTIESIPFDKNNESPYKEWLKANEDNIVGSDPCGCFLLISDRLWALEKQYHGSPVGERAAWEASQNSLPGECEGDMSCYFSVINLTTGQYLDLYPTGQHADEVLQAIRTEVKSYLEDLSKPEPTYAIDNADIIKDLQASIVTLRKYLKKVPANKSADINKNLDALVQKTNSLKK